MIDRPTTFEQSKAVKWPIFIRDDAGALVDADSNPSITVYKNGTVTGDSVTVIKRDSTTGIYDCSYNPASEVAGDCFGFEESVTVSSTTYKRNPWQCVCVMSLIDIESTVGAIAVAEYSAGDGTITGAILDVLQDTGTTLPAQISSVNDTVGDIDSATNAILTDTGTTLPAQITAATASVTVTSIANNVITSSVIANNAFTNSQFTTGWFNAVAGDVADQVWTETLADHSGTSGSTAEALEDAGGGGGGDATLAKQNEILGKLATASVSVTSSRPQAGLIDLVRGVDYKVGEPVGAIELPIDQAFDLSGKTFSWVVTKAGQTTALITKTPTLSGAGTEDQKLVVEVDASDTVNLSLGALYEYVYTVTDDATSEVWKPEFGTLDLGGDTRT